MLLLTGFGGEFVKLTAVVSCPDLYSGDVFFLFGKGFDVAIAFVYCVIFALSVTEGKSIDRRVDGCSGVWKRMNRRKVHVNHIPS